KWLIIGLSLLTTIGVYIYVRTLPEYFKATVNCVPPAVDAGGLGGALGGISSTLKDIGLSKLNGKSSDSYEFIAILFTRTIRDSMINRFDLVKEYKMENEPMKDVRSMLESNLEVNYHAEGNYEISIWSIDPQKSVTMCTAFIEYANEITNRIHRAEAEKSAFYLEKRLVVMDSVLGALTDSLGRYSKVYRLYSPLDQAAASASALSESKTELLKQETVLGMLEQNYGASDPQVKNTRALVDQLRVQFENAQTKPGFAGNFALTDAAGIGAQYMRVFAEFEAYTKLKAFLLPSLEQARLDMNKSAPSLIVIDAPVAPEKRDKPKRVFISVGTGLGVFILTMLILLALRGWRSMMSTRSELA
ncbi:MAG: hypothetical protein NTX15_02495, partial [Candidatus Kapabacteria bacterium]|nr:hypothetical protein [Candidatus Kapabacteria bacterium]